MVVVEMVVMGVVGVVVVVVVVMLTVEVVSKPIFLFTVQLLPKQNNNQFYYANHLN